MKSIVDRLRRREKVGFSEILEAFGSALPLLHELKNTPQDKEWHAEGDVEIHTRSVLAECYSLLEADEGVSEHDWLVMVLGAAFHDIGKALATKTRLIGGRERIVAPRHEDKGRSYLSLRLLDTPLSEEERRGVLEIVGHHGEPKHLVVRDETERRYRQLARLANLKRLQAFCIADIKGRVAKDRRAQLEVLELFKLQCEEFGVWNSDPYERWLEPLYTEEKLPDEMTREFVKNQAIWDFEKGYINSAYEALARTRDRWRERAKLTVLCGPSGSGKSTLIKRRFSEWELVSMDELREEITGKRSNQSKNGQVAQAAFEELKKCLRGKQRVVWDSTNVTKAQRKKVIDIGCAYGAEVELLVVEKAIGELKRANARRSEPVPGSVIEKQIRNLEYPYENEAHRVVYVS
ncbi:MAG: AAA family ATPase [Verrucomicrobiota bacterium]